jgi:hypothetical protein
MRCVMQVSTTAPKSPAAILARLFEKGRGEMTRELARHILRLGFPEEDLARIHELAEKNQEGRISPGELQELDYYVTAADWLSLLRSKARKKLGGSPVPAIMDELLAQRVRERAGRMCEYCRLPESLYTGPFEIEHVIAKQHGGPTSLRNLA